MSTSSEALIDTPRGGALVQTPRPGGHAPLAGIGGGSGSARQGDLHAERSQEQWRIARMRSDPEIVGECVGGATLPGPGAPLFVGVVIPANDEAGVVAHAIDAVRRAADHQHLKQSAFCLVVVDDSSSDMTAEHAAARLAGAGQVIRVEAHSAGAARRAGFAELCRASEGLDADRVWLATTDADTLVRHDWLARQLVWWHRGAEAVAGTVTPISWREQPEIVRRRYEALMTRLGRGFGHPHVHGANLGLTKAAYVQAGGVSEITSGEDHSLWDAVCRNGRAAVHVPDVVVATSTRREGRAPAGFSALLRSLEEST